MDEKRLQEKITRAVDHHCAHLKADPYLAQKVLREAQRKEPVIVKKKMSVGLVLTLILILLSATAVAAVLLTAMEVIEQEAVPMAQENDGGVRPQTVYSNEELYAILATAAENGLTLSDDSSVMRALRNGEGYYEEETIMALCREAFGGYFSEWSVEEKHWFEEMMIAIGFSSGTNPYELPGEGDLTPDEARALAKKLIWDDFGADIPLDDPAKYRHEEEFYDFHNDTESASNWYFNFYPKTLEGKEYYVNFDRHGQNAEYGVPNGGLPDVDWENGTYTEALLFGTICSTYGHRTQSQESWNLEAWYTFGRLLPRAEHSDAWDAEYDAYLATTYLLPDENDLSAEQAYKLAIADWGGINYSNISTVLIGKGDQRIWRVGFYRTDGIRNEETILYEIDSRTHEILHKGAEPFSSSSFARWVLHDTFAEYGNKNQLPYDQAIQLAQEALRKELGDSTIPFTDEKYFDIRASYKDWRKGGCYDIMFWTKVMDYPVCGIYVYNDGTTEIWRCGELGVNCDNLQQRYNEVYGSEMDWDQSVWVQFDQEMEKLAANPETAPKTFEGKLFLLTDYPSDADVKITRDQAMDIAYLDSNGADIIRCLLIDAEPNPVWKLRMGTDYPANTLYEIDAMTGEILDKEFYWIQMPDFDNNMMMYTLRKDYKPAALEEFGIERVAMELCVKANADRFYEISPTSLVSGAYRIEIDGMTATFTAIDPRNNSYVVTMTEDVINSQVEIIPGVEGVDLLTEEQKAEIYALYEDNDRFELLKEGYFHYDAVNVDPILGPLSYEEAQAHAFKLLLQEVGEDAVKSFDKFAVGYACWDNDIFDAVWRFYFVDAENYNTGWKVTFPILDGVPQYEGDVKDVNDESNG